MFRRRRNESGGGARTNENGLAFEQQTSFDEAVEALGYTVSDNCVIDVQKQCVGKTVAKYDLYSKFLKPNGVDYKEFNSKKWLPDDCFINEQRRIVFIIEKKFQNSRGSVDEKLVGCEFKKREYEKLFHPLGYKVVYIYVFNDWFKSDEYRDTLEYIKEKGCYYFFNEIPLEFLGL